VRKIIINSINVIKPILQQNKQNTAIIGRHFRMSRPLAGCSDEALQWNAAALQNLCV